MDKMVANGDILEYGYFANLIHQEGEPTHGSWFHRQLGGQTDERPEADSCLGIPECACGSQAQALGLHRGEPDP